MPQLASLAREYYALGLYEIVREAQGFFEAIKLRGDGSRDHVLVWADGAVHAESSDLDGKDREARAKREAELLAAFRKEMEAAPSATGYHLVPQRAGYSQHFLSEAARLLKGGIRVPVEFFDSDYLSDAGGKKAKASVAAAVFAQAQRIKRVPQAFYRRHGLDGDARELMPGDIVDHLKNWLAGAGNGPRLCLVDGSPGGGKTVAFNALARHAYDAFMERKRRKGKAGGEAWPGAGRPVIFLPQHLRRDGEPGYVDDILHAAADTDMAAPAEPGQLQWLLHNGFALWMFDGLDEFYAGQGGKDLFEWIGKELDSPGSKACFLLCSRDSLLTSAREFSNFLEERLGTGSGLEVLELAPWGEDAWRTIAGLELGGGAKAEKFVSALKGAPAAAELARLPFYCRVLIERFEAGGNLPADEFDLLDSIFERMVEREHGKAIFRWQDFVDEELLAEAIEEELETGGKQSADSAEIRQMFAELLDRQGKENVTELICTLAHLLRRTEAGEALGLETGDIRSIAAVSYLSNEMLGEELRLLDPEDSEETARRRLNVLVQFAFFGAGRRPGTVDFTHPIMADYLAGRYAVMLLRRGMGDEPGRFVLTDANRARAKGAIRQAIGTAPLDLASVFFGYIAREARRDGRLKEFFKAMVMAGFDGETVNLFMTAIIPAMGCVSMD